MENEIERKIKQFLEQFCVQSKTEQKVQGVSIYSLSPLMHNLPYCEHLVPHWCIY